MKCPFCGYTEDKVLETREQKDGVSIRRRRECLKCRSRFTTVEMLYLQFPMVIKKDGRREEFLKEKILKGIQAACQKRPIALSQMEAIVENIAKWALNLPEREISSQVIGEKVMNALKDLDDVAYVRFASVYRTFQGVDEFVQSLVPANKEGSGKDTLKPEQLTLL